MMRMLTLLVGLATGCAAGAPVAEHEPPVDQLRAAHEAYDAYCNMCRTGESCCLSRGDFAPERWSTESSTYLRAFRDYYECEYSDTSLNEAQNMNGPASDTRFPTMSNFSRNCEPHACQSHRAIMQRELDRALATPRPHPPGAVVVCSTAE